MNDQLKNAIRFATLLLICSGLGGCEDMHVYGSVGVSSYSGYYGGPYYGGGPRVGTSISIGGRIR